MDSMIASVVEYFVCFFVVGYFVIFVKKVLLL